MNGDSSLSRTHYESAMASVNGSFDVTTGAVGQDPAGDHFPGLYGESTRTPAAKSSRMSFFSMKQFDPLLKTPRTPADFLPAGVAIPSPVVDSPADLRSDGPLVPVTPVCPPVTNAALAASTLLSATTTPAGRTNGSAGQSQASFRVNGGAGLSSSQPFDLTHSQDLRGLLQEAWKVIDTLSATNEELLLTLCKQQQKIEQLTADQQSFAGVISEIRRMRMD